MKMNKTLFRTSTERPAHLDYQKQKETLAELPKKVGKTSMIRVDEQTKNKLQHLVKLQGFSNANDLVEVMLDKYIETLNEEQQQKLALLVDVFE